MTQTALELGDGRALRVYDTNAGDNAGDGAGRLAVLWHHGTPNIGAPPKPLFPAAARLGLRWASYDRPGYGRRAHLGPGLRRGGPGLAVEARQPQLTGIEPPRSSPRRRGAGGALRWTHAQPDPSVSLRQSFAWWSVARGVSSPQDFLRAARTIGYDAVELIPETLWPAVRDAGLAVSAAGGHESISSGLNRRENHPRIRREVEAKLRLAERWNVPNLICFSGNRDGQGDTTGAEVTAEGLAPLAPLAQSVGVTLVLELLNSRVDHPDYQCDRTGWGAGVVDRVGSPSVKLLYDVYHAQVMEGDLVRTIREHHERIGHYHTAGNPGRHELDDAQEIGYPAVFRAIRETGFEGYVAHEFLPTRDPLAGLKEAFDLVERSSEGR